MIETCWEAHGLNIPNNSSIFGGLKSLAFEFQGSVCEAFKLPSLQDAFLGFKVMVPLDNGEMKYFKQKFHQVSSDTEGRGQSTPWVCKTQTVRSFSHWKNEGHKIQEPKKSWMDDIPKISVQFAILSFALSTMPSSLLSPQTVRGNTAMANLEGTCQSAVASVLMILKCTCHYRSKKKRSAACERHRQSLSEEEFVSCAPSFFLASFCVHNCGDSTQKHLGTFPASASQMLGIRVTTARKAENNYIVKQWCRNSSPKSSTTGWS